MSTTDKLRAYNAVADALDNLRRELGLSHDTDNATIERLAREFCDLDDDGMAKFFCVAARIAQSWSKPASNQWYYVGRHLRKCACSTDEGRELVTDIADALRLEERVAALRPEHPKL